MLFSGFPDPPQISVQRDASISVLENAIYKAFPRVPLQLVGFTFRRCDKNKKLVAFSPVTIIDIEQVLGKGKLVIVPNRDIPLSEVSPKGTGVMVSSTNFII